MFIKRSTRKGPITQISATEAGLEDILSDDDEFTKLVDSPQNNQTSNDCPDGTCELPPKPKN